MVAPVLARAQDFGLAQRTVTGLKFSGNRAIDDRTLKAAIATSASSLKYTFPLGLLRWLPVGTRRYFDETEFRRDVARVRLFYLQHGYYDARVDTVVRRSGDNVRIEFRITENEPTLIDTVIVQGIDSVENAGQLQRRLLLRPGEPFNRYLFQASVDTLLTLLRDRGYPFAQVFRSYTVDRGQRSARVEFDVMTGRRARIGDIVIEGLERVSPRTVMRALRLTPGAIYRQQALFNSQRALYQRELFRYVNVGLADDSLVGGNDTLVRVRVRVVEAEKMTYRLGLGYGTIDCLRTSSNVTIRNFFGEARLLELTGRVTKIGVGRPLDFGGTGETLCPSLRNDRFSDELNFQLNATVTQPAVIIPRSTLSLTGFLERRSEFNAYRHQSAGGGVGLRVGFGGWVPPLSINYRLSRDRTDADRAVFCQFFDQCDPNTASAFGRDITQGRLSVASTDNTTNHPLEPTRGRILTLEATTSGTHTASEVSFNRFVGEYVQYFPIGRRTVLATRFRAGAVIAGTSEAFGDSVRYVPPPDRFYAGSPTTVRGFGRNEMGPVVYVADTVTTDSAGGIVRMVNLRSSPTGSAGIMLANAELRLPTPVFGGKLGFVTFVDAGRLWEQDGSRLRAGTLYVTPGIGVLFSSPLGPMRLDAAYNSYDPQPGRLYRIEGDTLSLVTDSFTRNRRDSFFRRIQWHFSVGQAF